MAALVGTPDLLVLRDFVAKGYVPNTDAHFDRRLDIVVRGIEECHPPSRH